MFTAVIARGRSRETHFGYRRRQVRSYKHVLTLIKCIYLLLMYFISFINNRLQVWADSLNHLWGSLLKGVTALLRNYHSIIIGDNVPHKLSTYINKVLICMRWSIYDCPKKVETTELTSCGAIYCMCVCVNRLFLWTSSKRSHTWVSQNHTGNTHWKQINSWGNVKKGDLMQ